MMPESPHRALLAALVRDESPESLGVQADALSAKEWTAFGRATLRQQVAPLAFRRLDGAVRTEAGVEVLGELRLVYDEVLRRNRRLMRRLLESIAALAARGIPAIVLKGGFLLSAVYRDLGIRLMSDLDLLVPRADLERAEAAFLDLGYGPQPRPSIDETCSWCQHIEPLVHPDGTSFDVHWTLEYPTAAVRIDTGDIWSARHFAQIEGVEARVLSPAQCVTYACVHAAFHHTFEVSLRQWYDIGRILRHFGPALDGADVIRIAHAWNAPRYVRVALEVTRELLGIRAEPWWAGLPLTEEDAAIVPEAAAHVLRWAKSGSPEWLASAPRLEAWKESVADATRVTDESHVAR